MELIGKTISGVVAVPGKSPGSPHKIWLLQFTDGSHVEFVSPSARRSLGHIAGRPARSRRRRNECPQLSLNVA